MTEAETSEKDAQSDYEQMLSDSAEKRARDSKALTDKTGAKAGMQSDLESDKESKDSTGKELMATAQYISSLHGECDWLLQTSSKSLLSRRQAPEDELAKEMTHDLEMNFNKIAPFGKEDTAKELQDHAAKTQ